VWCLFAALAAAAVAIAVPRVVAIESLPANWDAVWFLGAIGAGLAAAALWTIFSRRTALEAAIEIDRRFDLRERVASSLSLSEADRDSEAGRAVIDDALRVIRKVDVSDKFRIALNHRAWMLLVPASLAFLLVLVEPREATSSVQPPSVADIQKQIKQAAESARKKLAEQRKLAEKKGLKAAEGLFQQIEQGTRELAQNRDLDRTKAAVKLNDLAKQLAERRQQLGGNEAIRKQFQNMKNLGAGAGEKIAQAMKQGDWNKALEELDKLAKDLRDGKLDAEAQADLAKQLEKMKDKLAAAAEAHQQAMDDLKKQIEQAREQGDLTKAGQLQQKLDQLAEQMPQINQLQQMAQQLGQMQQALEQGDAQQAADAMAQMAQQLQQLQQQVNELEMLDMAMNQLEMAKGAMACAACQGAGCQACQGSMGQMGLGNNMNAPPGMGMGEGRGSGPRPDDKNPTSSRDSQVRQKIGPGAATFGGMVEGPNVKGNVAESIKEEMANLAAEPADPVANEQLPRSRREHAGEYFNLLREGR
jgi:hypothetical protein